MNWDTFGTIGYLGVLLAVCVPLLWLAYWMLKRRFLCRLSLLLAVAAWACAEINSATHVNRIQLDRSEQMAEWEAREEAKRQAVLDSRGDEVAQKRFAEDSADEFLDKAGLDESDLKYLESMQEDFTPVWKQEKKSRSGAAADDDSLEARIGGVEETDGVDATELEEMEVKPSALMNEADMVLANRLDTWNLRLSFWFLIPIAIVLLVIDYLRRANIYSQATFPLPLPSKWINAVTPMPTVVERPARPRRSIPAELAWLRRRGDSFLYLTDNRGTDAEVPGEHERPAKQHRSSHVLLIEDGKDPVDDDFVFEALWFGRSSFSVDSPARAEQMLKRFLELLEERKTTRARVRQTAHIVWDIPSPIPEAIREPLTTLAQATGLSLFLCHESHTSHGS